MKSHAELLTIAKRQRELIIGILFLVLFDTVALLFRSEILLFGSLIQIVLVLRLARVLKLKDYWACVIGSLFPLLGFIVLVYVNGRATRLLRAYDVKVGFLGSTFVPARKKKRNP